MSPLTRIVGPFAALVLFLLVGCGAPNPPASPTARATVTLLWPDAAGLLAPQFVSGGANSVVVSVSPADEPAAVKDTLVLNRDGALGSSGSLQAPIGADLFVARTYAGREGGGSLLGEGRVVQTIVEGRDNAVRLTVGVIVDSVSLALGKARLLSLLDGTTATPTARDAAGYAIASGPRFGFASSDPLVATVDASGSVQAVAPGTAVIIATDARSGKSGQSIVTVTGTTVTID